METAYAVAPLLGLLGVPGPNDAHGSDARSYWRSAGAFDAHLLKGSGPTFQVVPPSVLTPAARPWAPPLLQRSCWKTVTMLAGFVGFIDPYGSTSERG